LLDKDAKAKTTDHRSFYTDLTRARYAAVVYTNDRSALPQAVVRRSEKAAALDVVSGHAQQRRERGRAADQRTSAMEPKPNRNAHDAPQAAGRT
jgi:hypothetical protein